MLALEAMEKLPTDLGEVGDMILEGRRESWDERADTAGESVGRSRVARAERSSSDNVYRVVDVSLYVSLHRQSQCMTLTLFDFCNLSNCACESSVVRFSSAFSIS